MERNTPADQCQSREQTGSAPNERPIIMSGDNPKLILDDRKNQMRRLIKPQPVEIHDMESPRKQKRGDLFLAPDIMPTSADRKLVIGYANNHCSTRWMGTEQFIESHCPYGVAGDRLWVREKCWIDAKPVPQLGHRRVFFDDSRLVIHENGTRGESPHPPLAFVGNWKQTSIKRVPSIRMPRWASRITLEITKVRVERLQDISEEDAKAEGVIFVERETSPGHWNPCAVKNYAILWDSLHGKGAWEKNPWVWVLEFRRITP